MRRIDLTSAGFLLLEKRETPMHVGGINLFTLPGRRGPEQTFLTNLHAKLRDCTEFRRPFGDYVVTGKTGLYWEKDEHIDMDYHVRHSALPAPGRYRELFALASRLHTTLLDRTRPLWELHIIEGLQNRQFADLQQDPPRRYRRRGRDAHYSGHVHGGSRRQRRLRALLPGGL
jgi:diacylglycerol O-acyltransferase